MSLSKRLLGVVSLIDKNLVVADVGCDHALLSIHLIKEGISNKVYAIDNKVGPLSSAKDNILENNLENNVLPLLSDGLSALPHDVEIAIMAGIGGLLAIEMLKKAARIPSKIIIQANNHLSELRTYLCENRFKIVDELIVYDSDIYYEIIKAEIGTQVLSKQDIIFGPILRKNKDKIFIDNWSRMLNHYKFIVDKHSNENDLLNIKKYINLIENEIK